MTWSRIVLLSVLLLGLSGCMAMFRSVGPTAPVPSGAYHPSSDTRAEREVPTPYLFRFDLETGGAQ